VSSKVTDAVKPLSSATQLQPQGAQPTAGQTLALQPIDAFVEQHAKFPSGAYALPVWKTPRDLQGQDLFMPLKDHDGGEHPMSTALKTPSTLEPKISLEGTKDQAVEMWTLARKEWEERLSALTPGEQLYFTTAFISDETRYRHGFASAYRPGFATAPKLPPSRLLQCLIGEGSTPLAALKRWMADHPAEGTVEMYAGEHRSPLFALLDCTGTIMLLSCESDGYACGWSEISSAATLLMDAGAPFDATADTVAGYNTTNGVVRTCRQLFSDAKDFDADQPDLAKICRSFIKKIPAAER